MAALVAHFNSQQNQPYGADVQAALAQLYPATSSEEGNDTQGQDFGRVGTAHVQSEMMAVVNLVRELLLRFAGPLDKLTKEVADYMDEDAKRPREKSNCLNPQIDRFKFSPFV